jgi:hypothetical protein
MMKSPEKRGHDASEVKTSRGNSIFRESVSQENLTFANPVIHSWKSPGRNPGNAAVKYPVFAGQDPRPFHGSGK